MATFALFLLSFFIVSKYKKGLRKSGDLFDFLSRELSSDNLYNNILYELICEKIKKRTIFY